MVLKLLAVEDYPHVHAAGARLEPGADDRPRWLGSMLLSGRKLVTIPD